ncbi:MAG: TIGR02757 family protein [Bacteroidales bacterium]|nr:TIGR02757 family protein [Bacteroidales bacterium]
MLSDQEIKEFLEYHYHKYNRPEFTESDPVQVPHLFSLPEDIEIAGFLTACISWGQRKTIISKSFELMRMMGYQPYSFIMSGDPEVFEQAETFCHRTFNGTDMIFFLRSLQNIYKHHGGLRAIFERAFRQYTETGMVLQHFRKVFFAIWHPARSQKHIPDVSNNSSAKRLNMFLRWMVRNDGQGVDFGLWNHIDPARLKIPLDVHTGNVARQLGLLKRKQNDWQAVCELTDRLCEFDPDDPVKYDFALFGLGIFEKI